MSRWRFLSLSSLVVLLSAAVFLPSVVPVSAESDSSDLGKPTNAVPQFVPLGGFMHKGPNLRRYGLPQVPFIGTQVDPLSAAERWAVVKALDQFGVLSGVTPNSSLSRTDQHDQQYGPTIDNQPIPTFNWAHAHYRSRYLVFEHRGLLDVGDNHSR